MSSESNFAVLVVTAGDAGLPPLPADSGHGVFALDHCSAAEAAGRLDLGGYEAVITLPGAGDAVSSTDLALIRVHEGAAPQEILGWIKAGAQDVLSSDELALPTWPGRLRAAIERQRLLMATRQSYATDVLTGLPHEQQLLEHMSHLLALREREPSPMALLVLRVEGLATTQARLGREAASVLRRKLAVRVRAALRASDVVASIGGDSFAVLLSSIEAATDADLVGGKLLAALNGTFSISGQPVPVATALGVAKYPEDATQPAALLGRAVGLAASAQAVGRSGYANWVEGGGMPEAAND